ncbi:hypothetical protein TNCV_3154851 [Trichonephila clavipes]|nr:hypothetical protein TNCV_3154851 [Trichonephila clavipes]
MIINQKKNQGLWGGSGPPGTLPLVCATGHSAYGQSRFQILMAIDMKLIPIATLDSGAVVCLICVDLISDRVINRKESPSGLQGDLGES